MPIYIVCRLFLNDEVCTDRAFQMTNFTPKSRSRLDVTACISECSYRRKERMSYSTAKYATGPRLVMQVHIVYFESEVKITLEPTIQHTRLPCRLPRGQQMLHWRWLKGSHQVFQIQTLADSIESPKRGMIGSTKKRMSILFFWGGGGNLACIYTCVKF